MSESVREGISLGIEDEPELRAKMTAVGEKYDCDLIVYKNPVKMYRDCFLGGLRNFLKILRSGKTHDPSPSLMAA